jgi:hypothetical protein
VVGVIFCSYDCNRKFRSDFPDNPILFDYSKPIDPKRPVCGDCGNVLSDASVPLKRCRMCRLERTLKSKLTGEARRLARKKKVRDAQKRFGLPGVDLEVLD